MTRVAKVLAKVVQRFFRFLRFWIGFLYGFWSMSEELAFS
jgi:hypothetical protein